MKFSCACGDVIRDQSDSLPYKAGWIADEDEEKFFDELTTSMAKAGRALQSGEWQAFVTKNFGPEYPPHLDFESVLSDLLARAWVRFQRPMFECPNCGRLIIEVTGRGYSSFSPESPGRGVLAARQPEKT